MSTTSTIKVTKGKLSGTVKLSGAKNSALRLLAASILTDGEVRLSNFPNGLLDIQVHLEMLQVLGKEYVSKDDTVVIRQNQILETELKWDKRSIRNTLLILGALTARYGEGRVPLPGGCKLGERKYDIHVMLLEQLGAKVWEEEGMLCTQVGDAGRFIGNDIYLPIRSTGATENAILCGALANGITTVWNPHIRPEILDLIHMLNKMGADIKVFGQKCIVIQGKEELRGVEHEVIPDNMEALTWAIGSVITDGDVEILNFPKNHLDVPMVFLKESGMKIYEGENSVIVKGGTTYPLEISTGPYPGINSDMQPLLAVYGAMSSGVSKIVDLRFPGRYAYAEELGKMGMDFEVIGDLLVINGGRQLHGATVQALDLRAGIALLLAGLTAEGETVIENAWQIHRGYDDLYLKLKDLNIRI
ncbi:UDP-N-acetylglucosamine 1-carboxyvinyltransferase [Echinicola jeungdonensis]|uniref:UDP-N-acetylglucosamine 1-carboxyvinyltransferase n=1 Tax=Echinicola jeungdonensis TaxID=709343 RepID=A0ABV5J2U0_9BACT|nr:UDP-N-acetylglucosamine 1-carboxyvinyltransferase [Echinicola jeungdonensis]MDN3668123.1 UDP-N-acetylglucosamine 1-carboxyvinyltransferase [Echinicola jeungdonensis]